MKKVGIGNKGGFWLLCFYSNVLFSQFDYIKTPEELEKSATGWGNSLINIGIILGAIAAVYALVNIFKGIENGDEHTWRVAGGWFSGISFFIVGLWFVKTYVMR